MKISIDVESIFNKIQHPLIVIILCNLGNTGNFFNLIRIISLNFMRKYIQCDTYITASFYSKDQLPL